MTTIDAKSYTLTLNDCLEAFSQKKISPKRTYAPGLLLIGAGLASFLALIHLYLEIDSRKYEQVLGKRSLFREHAWEWSFLYAGCAIACAFGLLLWRWEGKSSLRRQTRNLLHCYRDYLTPKEASFDAEAWTVRHANGSEDKRKFAHLRYYLEKSGTIVLGAEGPYIFPKRVFSEDELTEIRRLCRAEVSPPETWSQRRRESVLIAFAGVMEYVLWRYRIMTAVCVLAPLVLAPWAFMNTHENPSGMTEYSFMRWRVIAATAIWYAVMLTYNIVKGISFARKVRYRSITDAEFTLTYQELMVFGHWAQFLDAHEGYSCFLFEVRTGSYQLFCKRVLSESEQELLRSKVASIKDTPTGAPESRKGDVRQ